jgi:cyclohexanecarboxylate-CoA ligase
VFDAEVIARYRELGWWRDHTYLDDIDARIAAQPAKVAIVSHRAGAEGPPRHTTYGELGEAVERIAAGLVALGVARGEVVSVQLPNCWEFAAIVVACAQVGAVASPLVPIYRHRELRFMIGRAEARVAIVPGVFRGFDHAAMLDDLAADLPALQHHFVMGDSFEPWFLDQRHDVAVSGRAIGPDELCELQFTSGTTGEPKGVQHTPNTIWAGTRALGDTVPLGPGDVTLMASTLAHQTGFLYGIVEPLAKGQTVVYQDVWDPAAFLDLVERHEVTFTMGATPFVADAVAAQQANPRDLATLRAFVCAGAPIPPDLVRACNEVLGCELLSAWGMTENAAVTVCPPGTPLATVADSDGVAVPWMEVRVVADGGAAPARGAVGRLQVRGANQTPGYFRRPDLYAESLVADPAGGGPLVRDRRPGLGTGRRWHPHRRPVEGPGDPGRRERAGGRGRGAALPPPPGAGMRRGGLPRRPVGGAGVRRRGAPRCQAAADAGRPHRPPRRRRHGPSVLARTAGGGARDATHTERQDPEVRPARPSPDVGRMRPARRVSPRRDSCRRSRGCLRGRRR